MLEAALMFRTPHGNRIIIATSTSAKDVALLRESIIESLNKVREGDPSLIAAKGIEVRRFHELMDLAHAFS